MEELIKLKCIPCRGGDPPVTEEQAQQFLMQVPDWVINTVEGVPRLVRTFKFGNFRQALDFTVRVGELAEQEDHHPLLQTEWGRVGVNWWTHKIKGLHRNDFIMAAKTDALYARAE